MFKKKKQETELKPMGVIKVGERKGTFNDVFYHKDDIKKFANIKLL